jgi:hypothetical protein
LNAARLAVAAGFLWVARAGVGLADPLYYDPSTVLDYSAVVLTTLATVVTGLVILEARPRLGRVARILAFIPAIGFITMGVANLFEDAFGIEALGVLWGLSGLSMMVGLVLATVASLVEPDDRKLGFGLLVFTVASLLPEGAREWAQGAAMLLMAYLLSLGNEAEIVPEVVPEA